MDFPIFGVRGMSGARDTYRGSHSGVVYLELAALGLT